MTWAAILSIKQNSTSPQDMFDFDKILHDGVDLASGS